MSSSPRPRRHAASAVLAALLLLGAATPAAAQNVGGHAFEDRNANGIWDPNEPWLAGVPVHLYGKPSSSSQIDLVTATDPNGFFQFAPGNGCYVLSPDDPPGWRFSGSRSDGFPPSTPGYTAPVGQPRFSKVDLGIANLRTGTFRFSAMGDSIARNFNLCTFPTAFLYSSQVLSRLECTTPGITTTLDQAAVLGEHTDDLLVDDHDDLNNVFRMIEAQPDLITISMIGNDLLAVDPGASPTQAQINAAVAEILDSRQNLQEAISALTASVPGADIVLNTLYDNLAYNCATGNSTTFHREWLPIVNVILRDIAWGQRRRASITEAFAEFAHEDMNGGCTGFTGLICRDLFGLDNIHPTSSGYSVLREKLWEGTGGVSLGSGDALMRTSISADHGFLRRVRRLLPSIGQVSGGASVTTPAAAFDDQDGGAPARISLGAGAEEFRLSGFPDWYDEIQIVRVVAGVRYRTSGSPVDDFYRMEASLMGQFRPPAGFNYTSTNWNFYTPIVGGGGPNEPSGDPNYPTAKVLAVPAPAAYREASSTLSKNPVRPAGAAELTWPAVTHPELATTTIRVASAPVAATAGNDTYQIELDAAWLDVYGWEKPRPPEAANLRVDPMTGGTLRISFDPVPGALRYNVYTGRLSSLRSGAYDHGASAPAGPLCNATTQNAGGGRLAVDLPAAGQPAVSVYFLVTAHVDDVESPAGFRSIGAEIDRSQSICR